MIAGPEKAGNNRESVGYKRPPKSHRFKPGNNGNVDKGGGRPRGTSLGTLIRKALSEPDRKYGTKADKLIAVMEKHAMRGDFRFVKEILDRHDGKMPDHVANEHGGTIKICVQYVRARRHVND